MKDLAAFLVLVLIVFGLVLAGCENLPKVGIECTIDAHGGKT